jgi:ferredoxin
MEIDRTKCMYCGACVGTCPTLALLLEETRVRYFEAKCIRCGFCEIVCPPGAIDLEGEGAA